MKVFVIGATGGVGHRLMRALIERGDDVRALHRRPEQASDLRAAGAEPFHADLAAMTEDDLASMIAGTDALVFAAGAGGVGAQLTSSIDGEGVSKSIAAARAAGVRRFILVSVFPEAWRERPRDEGFEHYLAVKKQADVELAASDLDWVILRPAELTDRTGNATISISPALIHTTVSRDNVAATLAELVHRPEVSRVILEVTDGPTRIREAIGALGV
ncbi:NAD(P)H-binding protein [Mycobacterium sp. ITM-2016-00317]|uniref:NAD(P)H-binding protein n=1 Tax=Mycobacterium sp. ITM-2016-00317 TaxID=2099694 RepID=UPI000D4E4596|nr:NAD(P)H-binding protein [Mycobacterium sp. ITM-2016-00317]WNG87609.1 NAD(P)H-binding protein [Mycobacterium sp. ITM-2016-00317]